ncbi:dentin sialophosphoprotein-like isoform X1 [Saccostrea cucullata]|uniref:dentin sialophosphoprotein-like isoform X1 n=1 Tax=Saccostrea cuccullata TaxID=36930 RepID=UPI002ED44D82
MLTGVGGYIQCREFSTPTQNQGPNLSGTKSSAKKKSWSPNSKSDLPPGKQGTHGSLDDLCMDPEISSVWLQSQDFVGLGFNIAGSMRDGIFVSQVHGRGPAVESGKFHVGDRILSVTVSFENMVYEDALTILSYASPYPVKITLQKEKPSKSKERRSGHQRSILSHPLYRSQSMDTLLKINKEPVYTPKRSNSEMRQPKEVLDNLKQTLKVNVDSDNRQSSISEHSPETRQSNVSEHSPEIHVSAEVEESIVTQDKQPVALLPPPPSGDEDDDLPPPQPTIPPPPLEFNDTLDGEISTPTSTRMQFSSAFENLNEQDKLDMIRLSYEDPDTKINKEDLDTSLTKDPGLADVSFQSDSTATEGEPKSPTTPVKPERKKKKSSSETSSLSSLDEAGEGQRSPRDLMPDIVEDHISVLVSGTQNAAPSVEPSEVFEDEITPQKSDREIKISSGNIELSSCNVAVTSEGDLADSPRDTSRTLVDYSLSDMESTLRPHTPENQPSIDEDIITPVQLKRGELESSMLNYFNDSGNTSTSTVENQQSLRTDSPNTTVTSVEFNLNMNSDLFSTPYPKRNTKEGHSGMSYDISMMELNDIEKKLKQKTKEHTKQGVAFEVRDDVLSGETVMSRLNEEDMSGHVSRTKSCEDNLAKKAMLDNSLSWSGKRLVRAGSFSELPQDDSSDWVDHNSLNNDESIISQEEDKDTFNSSEESLNSNNKNGLKKAKMFGARENLANLSSENSGSQQSISDSLSGGSTTPPPYLSNNGAHNGGTSSQDSTPVKPHINLSTSNIDSSVKVGENGPYSLSGEVTPGDEEDC